MSKYCDQITYYIALAPYRVLQQCIQRVALTKLELLLAERPWNATKRIIINWFYPFFLTYKGHLLSKCRSKNYIIADNAVHVHTHIHTYIVTIKS